MVTQKRYVKEPEWPFPLRRSPKRTERFCFGWNVETGYGKPFIDRTPFRSFGKSENICSKESYGLRHSESRETLIHTYDRSPVFATSFSTGRKAPFYLISFMKMAQKNIMGGNIPFRSPSPSENDIRLDTSLRFNCPGFVSLTWVSNRIVKSLSLWLGHPLHPTWGQGWKGHLTLKVLNSLNPEREYKGRGLWHEPCINLD